MWTLTFAFWLALGFISNPAPVPQDSNAARVPLMTRATRIADTKQWYDSPHTLYRWISNRKLIYIKQKYGWHYFALDCSSGASIALEALDEQIAQSPLVGSIGGGGDDGLPNGMETFEVSPNAKYVLWNKILHSSSVALSVATPAGDPICSSHHETFSVTRWLPDNHHWFEVTGQHVRRWSDPPGVEVKRRITIHSVDNPDSIVERAIPASVLAERGFQTTIGARALLDGSTHLYFLFNDYSGGEISAFEWDMNSAHPTVKHYSFVPPSGTTSGMRASNYIVLSPNCDRVAWYALYSGKGSPLTLSLWVANLDGSAMHEIGYIPVTSASEARRDFHNIRWLPDGKQLSFVYKDELYVAPIQ